MQHERRLARFRDASPDRDVLPGARFEFQEKDELREDVEFGEEEGGIALLQQREINELGEEALAEVVGVCVAMLRATNSPEDDVQSIAKLHQRKDIRLISV